MTTQDILQAAAQLPESERVKLVEGLLATFDPANPEASTEAAAAWREVASERAQQLDRGEAVTIPWEEVRLEGERRIRDRTSR